MTTESVITSPGIYLMRNGERVEVKTLGKIVASGKGRNSWSIRSGYSCSGCTDCDIIRRIADLPEVG